MSRKRNQHDHLIYAQIFIFAEQGVSDNLYKKIKAIFLYMHFISYNKNRLKYECDTCGKRAAN